MAVIKRGTAEEEEPDVEAQSREDETNELSDYKRKKVEQSEEDLQETTTSTATGPTIGGGGDEEEPELSSYEKTKVEQSEEEMEETTTSTATTEPEPEPTSYEKTKIEQSEKDLQKTTTSTATTEPQSKSEETDTTTSEAKPDKVKSGEGQTLNEAAQKSLTEEQQQTVIESIKPQPDQQQGERFQYEQEGIEESQNIADMNTPAAGGLKGDWLEDEVPPGQVKSGQIEWGTEEMPGFQPEFEGGGPPSIAEQGERLTGAAGSPDISGGGFFQNVGRGALNFLSKFDFLNVGEAQAATQGKIDEKIANTVKEVQSLSKNKREHAYILIKNYNKGLIDYAQLHESLNAPEFNLKKSERLEWLNKMSKEARNSSEAKSVAWTTKAMVKEKSFNFSPYAVLSWVRDPMKHPLDSNMKEIEIKNQKTVENKLSNMQESIKNNLGSEGVKRIQSISNQVFHANPVSMIEEVQKIYGENWKDDLGLTTK